MKRSMSLSGLGLGEKSGKRIAKQGFGVLGFECRQGAITNAVRRRARQQYGSSGWQCWPKRIQHVRQSGARPRELLVNRSIRDCVVAAAQLLVQLVQPI